VTVTAVRAHRPARGARRRRPGRATHQRPRPTGRERHLPGGLRPGRAL